MDIFAKTDQSRKLEPIDDIEDREWLKNTFLLSDSDFLTDKDYKRWILLNRYRSSADYKVTCTAPGMNLSCNPRPQFTRYADIRSKGKLKDRSEVTLEGQDGNQRYGLGMGRYYSEAIDDNAQRIFMRFGVPTYQPIISWVRNAFDIKKAALNNRGMVTSVILDMVDIVTGIFAIAAAPILALGLAVVGLISGDTRFYSMKPTMHLYWMSVENMLNTLAARRTLLPNILPDFAFKVDSKIGQEKSVTNAYINQLHALLPDVIDSVGRISVFGLALKAQAAFNRVMHETSTAIIKDGEDPSKNFIDYPINTDEYNLTADKLNKGTYGGHDTEFTNKAGKPSAFTQYLFKNAADILTPQQKPNSKSQSDMIDINPLYMDSTGKPINMSLEPTDPDDTVEKRVQANVDENKSFFDKYKSYVLAEMTEGAAFAVFSVESTGSVGESFSNSTTSNPLEGMFNSMSDKTSGAVQMAKQAAGVVPFLDSAISMLGDVASTTVSNATFGLANPLLALAYGLHVSMPKVWESSSSSLPRASYKLRLFSPYGNAYSQLFNIYLPLSMILAGGLPRTTGGSSHTAPFLAQVYDRGRVQISLGMIDSINVTRGTSNLAFSRRGQTNAVDVDFTVANLDEVLSMDAFEGGIISEGAKAILNPHSASNAMQDYISVLAGLDVFNQVYMFPKMRLRLAEIMMQNNRILDPDPAFLAGFTIGRFELPKSVFGNAGSLISQIR